jgi:hypothetical protein
MCKEILGVRECDRWDGASNFIPWKLRFQLLVEEADLWEHVLKEILKPTDPTKLSTRCRKKPK